MSATRPLSFLAAIAALACAALALAGYASAATLYLAPAAATRATAPTPRRPARHSTAVTTRRSPALEPMTMGDMQAMKDGLATADQGPAGVSAVSTPVGAP